MRLVGKTGYSRRILSVVMSAALVLNGPLGGMAAAQAQVVSDPRASIQFQPRVGVSPNGAPVVDVTKPSFGGLSHNKYDQYNVDTRGVILNNSGLAGTSILGGQIWANPNLQNSRPASVILNEVTGSSSSLLNGPTEVFGSRADVIVANPNGVVCSSCSFINTGRVTLSSGVPIPDYGRGTVSFSVTRGKVTIEGSGVAAYNSDGTAARISDLDLVARQIEVNGPINASGAMRMRAGAINWNQTSDTATQIAGAPSVTGPGILTGVNGSIQAGTISAISHDINVGVQFNGDLTALGIETPDGRGGVTKLSGLVAVSSAGDVSIASAGSTGDVRYDAAGALTINGTQQAMGRLTGAADTITIGAVTVSANDAIVLEAVRDFTSQGALQAGTSISVVGGGNVTASGTMAAGGQIDIEGANIAANQFQAVGSSVNVAGLYTVSLEQTVLAGDDRVSVLGQDMRLGQGTGFQSNGPIYIDVRGTLTNATTLNYPNLTLNLGRSLVNEATGQIVADNLALTLSNSVINAGLLYGRLSTVLRTGTLTNQDSGIVYGPDVTISVSQNLINAGKILSEGKLAVTALGALQNDGAIQANGDIALKSASYTANSAQAVLAGAKADLIIAGAFDNAGMVQGLDGVTLNAASLNNRTTATIYGDGISLTLSGAASNAGQILSTGTLSIAAGDVWNAGSVQANRAIAINATSYGGDVGSKLTGDAVTAIITGNFANNGTIIGSQGVTASAASLGNGGIIYGDAVSLTIGGDVSNAGQILSETNLTLSAAALFNNGAIQANNAVGLTVASYNAGAAATISGTSIQLAALGAIDNAGKMLADDTLLVSGASLTNRTGSQLGGYDVGLAIGGDVNNAGAIDAQNILNLSGNNLSNSGKITAFEASRFDPNDGSNLLAGIALSGSLTNSGIIQTTNNLIIDAASLSNTSGATLQAKTMQLSMPGALNNQGVITSDTWLLINASDLSNSGTSANNAVMSGNWVQIILANELTNGPNSLLQGLERTVISANTANLDLFHANDIAQGQFNYGKNFALTLRNQGLTIAADQSLIVDGSLSLNYGGDVNVFGTLASRSDLELITGGTLTVGRNDSTNPGGGEIFTRGNASIIAAGDINNYASVIQSLGSMSIEAGGTLTNTRTAQTSWVAGTFKPSPAVELYFPGKGDKYLEIWTATAETSQAAELWADGNLVIKAGSVVNDASTIFAGNILKIDADTIDNTSREIGTFRRVYKVEGDSDRTGTEMQEYRAWVGDTHRETTAAMIGVNAVVEVGGRITGNGLTSGSVIRIDANTLVNGITDPNRVTPPPRLPDPVIDLTSYFNTPGVSGVNGRNGGFSGPSANPVIINGITYLHAAPIPGDANERGPGWILQQVGDVRTNLTFFFDPTTERRAIQQAIIDQTGRAYLDPRYRDPAEQQDALWQATVDFLKAHPDIHLGDNLTAEQRASLTEPILWYVAQNINGQTVLVPQLILPESRLAEWTKSNGGVMAGDDIYLSGSSIHNTGAILAGNTLSISADTFTNERRVATIADGGGFHIEALQTGGLLAGNVVQIVTTGDLINIGGTIIADRALNLVAGGDLVLTASVVHNEGHEGGKRYSFDFSSTQNSGGTVYSGGDATLFAGHDLKIEGSNVIALGNASLMAGNDLSITSVTNETQFDQSGKSSSVWRTRKWKSSDNSTTEVSSNIVAGGNLTVAAAGNVDIHASNLIAGNDMLVAAGAGANGKQDASVTITAGQNTTSHSYSETKTGIGVGSGDGWVNVVGKKTVTTSTDVVENVASTLAAGGNLTITAPQDINIQGSVVSAGGTAALSAGHDINVTPGENGTGFDYSKTVSGYGFGASAHNGSAKVQEGFRREKTQYTLDTTTVVPSVIQGGTGVVMNAGNDINLQAAVVASPGDITITAGHDVTMTVAYNTSSEKLKHSELFVGVTAQVSQNVTGIISDMRRASEIFNSGHGGAGYEAIGVISGVLKMSDAIATAAGGPRVSASVTVGGEGKSSSSYTDSLIAQGTALDAGGNLTITAGNDVHMAGVQGHVGGDINLSAGYDLIIESAQSYAASGSKEQSWNAGVGVSASAGATGYSVGVQINGGFSQSEYTATGTQQVNTHLFADGAVNMHSGNDTTIAGAVIHGSDVNIDVGNNLTIQSRQDFGHSEGEAIRGGGSITIGYGFSGSAYGGGGSSTSDVAWVREQTGIYSDGTLNIRVENHTQVDGAVINSNTGALTLDTGTLGFSTIKDHDTGSAFDMTIGVNYSDGNEKTNNYPWMPATNGSVPVIDSQGNQNARNPQTGSPNNVSVSGSIENHDRQQDTNATIGAGTITIRNQDAQTQDVSTLNRDVSQAQVITKNESSGVQFYVSSQSLDAASKGFTNIPQEVVDTVVNTARAVNVVGMGVDAAVNAIVQKMVSDGDLTQEEGNQTRVLARIAARDPEFARALAACGEQQGFNLLDLFVTKAHAFAPPEPSLGSICTGIGSRIVSRTGSAIGMVLSPITESLPANGYSSVYKSNDGGVYVNVRTSPETHRDVIIYEPNGDYTVVTYQLSAGGAYKFASSITTYADGSEGPTSASVVALAGSAMQAAGIPTTTSTPNATSGGSFYPGTTVIGWSLRLSDDETLSRTMANGNFSQTQWGVQYVSIDNGGVSGPVYFVGGADRAATYSDRWPTSSLSQAIQDVVGSNPMVTFTESGKTVFTNNLTGMSVTYDNAGNYFRVQNSGGQFLTQSGNILPNNVPYITPNRTTQTGIPSDIRQSITHFNNSDQLK